MATSSTGSTTITTSRPFGKLGASAVFLTAVSTILGAILFLRFGYAVGHVGLAGTLIIVAIAHVVTIPTSMAIAEIATNQRVAGGGAYYIVSRSFGAVIGAAIGIALYLSQAISVAFYAIAFAEAFRPVFHWIHEEYGIMFDDPRIVSVPLVVFLILLTLWKGADVGVKALYVVVAVLFASLVMFFIGDKLPTHTTHTFLEMWTARIESPDGFFYVFAIIFPAFTGVAAGLGLSGDLRNPKRDIPLGTIAATVVGMLVYVAVAFKLALSAPPADLAGDQLVMSRIAVWGPIIPIGLGCATLSSAVGSMLVAPRTLQAIGADRIFPGLSINRWVARGRSRDNEPVNATMITSLIVLVFVAIGDVNFVAEIISMFFMLTYGAICSISFLEHFAADPSYRPAFRSRWYLSLLGAIACFWLMFLMNSFYAVVALAAMIGMYFVVARYNPDKRGLANIFQGAIFQVSRQLHVFLQKSDTIQAGGWRPAVVCISQHSFRRLDAFELLRWISYRYGFGTYIHHIEGYLSKATNEQASKDKERLVDLAAQSRSNVYIDTLVCPSSTSAVAQVIQLPGISGKENNMIVFEYSTAKGGMQDLVDNYQLCVAAGFDVCLLGTSSRGFGYRHLIDIWLSPADYGNAALMILMAYVILGHPDWKNASIRVFLLSPEQRPDTQEEEEQLATMIREGRLPISEKNIEKVVQPKDAARRDIIKERSEDADLVIIGFRGEVLKRRGREVFEAWDGIGNVLFVNTTKEIEIDRPDESAIQETGAPDEEELPKVVDITRGESG